MNNNTFYQIFILIEVFYVKRPKVCVSVPVLTCKIKCCDNKRWMNRPQKSIQPVCTLYNECKSDKTTDYLDHGIKRPFLHLLVWVCDANDIHILLQTANFIEGATNECKCSRICIHSNMQQVIRLPLLPINDTQLKMCDNKPIKWTMDHHLWRGCVPHIFSSESFFRWVKITDYNP